VKAGDGPLRTALGAALASLVVVAVVAALTVHRPSTDAVGTSRVTTDGNQPGSGHRHGTPPASSASTTPPTKPSSRPGVRPAAGGGCGLALTPAATTGAVGHCTVLEIGDSLGNDIGWGLQRELAPGTGLTLDQLDTSATGLVNTAFYDWPQHLAADLRQYHPQLVVICMGGNDEQGMVVNGSVAPFGSPTWKEAYLARASALVHEATAAGAYVLWVGMPIMEQPEFSAGMEILNSVDQQAAEADPNAVFLPVWQLFSDPAGQFQSTAAVNGAATTLREPDGVHYSFLGENVIATYVLEHIASTFHVHLTPQQPARITGWG